MIKVIVIKNYIAVILIKYDSPVVIIITWIIDHHSSIYNKLPQ